LLRRKKKKTEGLKERYKVEGKEGRRNLHLPMGRQRGDRTSCHGGGKKKGKRRGRKGCLSSLPFNPTGKKKGKKETCSLLNFLKGKGREKEKKGLD